MYTYNCCTRLQSWLRTSMVEPGPWSPAGHSVKNMQWSNQGHQVMDLICSSTRWLPFLKDIQTVPSVVCHHWSWTPSKNMLTPCLQDTWPSTDSPFALGFEPLNQHLWSSLEHFESNKITLTSCDANHTIELCKRLYRNCQTANTWIKPKTFSKGD